MKKIALICKNSIFTGVIVDNTAEIIDSLANSLTDQYEVYVISLRAKFSLSSNIAFVKKITDRIQKTTFSKVTYFTLKDAEDWENEVNYLINEIQPNIIHNFAESDLIKSITFKPEKTVFTFNKETSIKNMDDLLLYDCVTTTSKQYANNFNRRRATIKNITGITSGLLTPIFTPEKGLGLATSFNSKNLKGKNACKRQFLLQQGLLDKQESCVFLLAGLHENIDIREIIEIIPLIREINGIIVIATRSNLPYDEVLKQYSKKEDGVIYYSKYPTLWQIPNLLSSADFYIHPHSEITNNLVPLLASQYGAIPILCPDHHSLSDTFNDDNALIVKDHDYVSSIKNAIELYKNKDALTQKRIAAMETAVPWSVVKNEYIELYEQ